MIFCSIMHSILTMKCYTKVFRNLMIVYYNIDRVSKSFLD